MPEAPLGAPTEVEASLEIRDSRLDTRAESLELIVGCRRGRHVRRPQTHFLVEHQVGDPHRLGFPQIAPAGVTGVAGHMLRRRTRGTGRPYSVILISRAELAGPPPTVTSVGPEEWTQVEIRLEDFPTATPEIIAALAFVAEGRWGFEVHVVEVR